MAINEIDSPFADGAAVKAILETSLTAPQLSPFIVAAERIVRNNLLDKDLDNDTLKEIARWLAAHFAVISRERREKSESIGGEYSVTYESGQLAAGLESSFYGQTALALDDSGTLKGLNMKKARVKVIEHDV